jgi:hypothetical protein
MRQCGFAETHFIHHVKKTSTLAHTNTTGPHHFSISILAFPFLSWDFGAPKALYTSLNSIRSETVCQFLSFCRFLCSPGRLGVLNLRGSTLTFHTSGQLVAKWQQLEILAGLYSSFESFESFVHRSYSATSLAQIIPGSGSLSLCLRNGGTLFLFISLWTLSWLAGVLLTRLFTEAPKKEVKQRRNNL